MKTNSEVETTKDLVAGNQGPRDGENFLESPRLIPIAGEENSSSLQEYRGKDMINGADREKSKTDLIDEEELKYQDVEVTVIQASLPGTQSNAEEESQALNRDETRCVVQEETTMHLQEATSEQTPEEKDHLPDSTQDINLEAAKLFVSANKGAGQQKIFNTSTASFEDPQEAGPPIREEKDSAILSILHSKNMEPQGPHSSLNVEDETTKNINFPSGIEDESDHTEVAKENFQDVDVQPQLLNVKDEPTEKAKNLSSFLRILSTEKESRSSHSKAKERNPQDTEMLPLSVIEEHETANEVESLSKHTGHASRVIECSKEHSETTEGNTQDVERLLHSINMENETTKEAEISSDLAKNTSTARESRTDDNEVIDRTSEDPKILSHSVFLEDETTEEVECFSEHTSTVYTETEYGTDPVTKANIHQAEILSPDQNMEKAGNLSVLARNVSMESGGSIYYFEAAKAEISEDIEILSVNSLITPSMIGTRILEAESGETICENKSNDNGKKKENFELKRPDLHSANVSVSSGTDCPNKHDKEDIENGCPAEKVRSPLVDQFTEEILLRDVGQEKVQELEAHSGTMFEKEDEDVKDTFDIKPAPVKEVSGIVPIVAKENQAEVGNLKGFLEEVAIVKSTKSSMVEAEEKPESSSNYSVMEKRETSKKETQEQVIVELLAGKYTKDEVSKGLTEANTHVEVPVIPEILNIQKDLEAPLFKTEPGKEKHSESLKAASMSLQKIESSQHFERKTSVQEERSIECSEGGLCEEKESTSNASKSKVKDSLQENTTIDGSNKEIDSAVRNNTAQETDEADQCPESTILEELPPEESSQELRSTTAAEDDKHKKNDLIDIEDKTQQKDFPSQKDETFAPQSYTNNKRKLVEHFSVGNNRTKCLKGGEDYISEYEEIKSNDLEEAASELKEDHVAVEEVKKDTLSKDEERETHIIAKEQIVPEHLLTFPSLNKQAAHPEANDDEEIKGRGPDEGAPELKEDQSIAKEARKDTLGKHEEEMQTVDKEATNPEVGNKREAFYSNHNEEIKGHDYKDGPPELKKHIVEEEANKDTCGKDEKKEALIIDKEEVAAAEHVETNPEADDIHKDEVCSNDNEEIKAKDSTEGGQELKDYEILANESHKKTFSKDDGRETQITDKEKQTAEFSAAEKNKSDHEITTKEINPEADELHNGKADHHKEDKDIEDNDSEEGTPELKEDQNAAEAYKKEALELKDQISAEKVDTEIFRHDRKKTEIIENKKAATELVESSFTEENQSDHMVTSEGTNPEGGEVHQGKADHLNDNKEIEGNVSVEGAPEQKEDQTAAEVKEGALELTDQISAEQVVKEIFREDDRKETQIIEKEEAGKELEESSFTEEIQSDHKITSEVINPGAGEVHQAKADHLKDNKETKGNYSEEVGPEPKECQISAEEVHKDTFCKDEEKVKKMIDKQKVATEYFVESSVTKENKSCLLAVPVNPEADIHKHKGFYSNSDGKIKSIHREEGASELKEDQVKQEEANEETISKDEKKGPQIIDKEAADTEYLVESSLAEENKVDKVAAEVTYTDADELHQGKADHLNDDKEIKSNDSEKGAAELKEELKAYKDTFSKDEEKEMEIIHKQEVATEYLVEFFVAEEGKSSHEVTAEETNLEAEKLHQAKVDHLKDDDVKDNDYEEAPEPKEDQLQKDKEKEPNVMDKEKGATENSEEFCVADNKFDHEAVNTEDDDDHKGEAVYRNDDENMKGNGSDKAAAEPKEDQILAEKTKEEFRSERDIVTSSAEEMKIQNSCEENQKEGLDRERISQHHNIEKQISKENDSSKDCHAKSLEEEIVQESFQEAEANKQKSVDIQMNIEEILNLAIPIPTQGERSVEGSLKNEEGNVMEPEKETKDMDIEGTTKNDAATYTAKEGEKVTVKNEKNAGVAGDTAGALRLAEGPSPTEYQGQAENSSKVTKISAKRDKKMSEIMESAEIRPVEANLKKEEWNALKPQTKRTKYMNKEDTTNNDVIQCAPEGEMEDVKEETNADVAGDTAGTIRISEGLPPREYQEQGFIAAPEISEESKGEMLEVRQSAQKGEMQAVKEERNAHVAVNTTGTTKISEGLPPREYQEQGCIAAPETSEESKEEMLVDTKVLTEIRSVEGSLIQEDWNVMEPEKEIRDLDKEGTTQDDDATVSTQENERGDGLTEKLTTREYQELLHENSRGAPDFSEETNEKMLDATESAGIRPIKEALKKEEQIIVEQEKETKDLHIEGMTQNDEATHTASEGETKAVKHEENLCAADVDRLIKGLPQKEYQEFSENSSVVLDISEERNEARLDPTESKGIKLVEGNSKKEEWDVKELKEEINDLDREGTTQKDKDTLSANVGEKETVKHEGNPNTTCTNRPIEEFPPKKYQEDAENSSGIIDTSEEWSKKILDTTESTELRTVEETLKQEERIVMEQEKETKDLQIEGTMQNDDTTYNAEEGEKEMVRHEGNENAVSTNKLAAEDQPENCSEVTKLSMKSKEKMPDTMEQAAIRSEEGSLKQEELEKEDVEMENVKRDANSGDILDTIRWVEGLPPREYQEQAENSNSTPKTEQGKEKRLDSKVSIESEGSLKQEEWDVMGIEKEKKDLTREGIIQNDKARHLIKVAEKDTIKHEGIPEVTGTDGLTEEFPEREYQELAQKSSEVPAISNEMNEKMLETKESTEMRLIDGTSKQEECIPMEQGKETKYLHAEGKTQNDGATHTAEEGQKGTFKHEGNPEAPNTDRATKGLPAREYQELAEYSTAVPDISEERNKKMSPSMESKEIKLVEGSLKENEWNAMELEKAKKDLVREGTTEKDALSAKEGEKDTIKRKGNPDAEGTNQLTEELPGREYKELAENSNVVPDISKERNNKMLDATGKETKDFDREGKTQKDEAILSAKEVEEDTVKNEGSPDAASIDVVTEELPAREYKTFAGNSNVMPDITKQSNDKMLDIIESTEIRPTKESLKQKEVEVMELEKETKDTHEEGTIQNDEEKESVKNKRNASTAGANRLAEELLPREHQELTENSSILPEITLNISNVVPNISKENNNKMLDATEKETKDFDREVKTQKDEATFSANEIGKDMDKNEGSQDAASINLLTEELPPKEYRELPENYNVMPDITEQQNEKMLDITESIEIRKTKESLKQKEWKVMEQEKETKYLHEEGKEQNDEATHSAHEVEKETVKNEGNANAACTNRIAELLLPREHQELAENPSTQHEISEKNKERMLDIIESAETIKDEKSSKQEGWDVIGSGKEEGGKEMIEHVGYPGATSTDMLIEGLPPRECQEFAKNTSEAAEISEKSKEKMLDIMELTQIMRVEEILNKEEWNVMESEKETKDLNEGMTNKDSTTLSAQEGGKETIKHEGIQDDALTKRLTEQLPPREYQELAENSSVMPHMSKEKNEIMSDITEFKEIEPVEGSSKKEELDVMEPEKTRDLHKEATTLNREGKNETVKHAGNPAAADTHKLTEELPTRECPEPVENSNAVPDIHEKGDKTMLDTITAKEIKLVERSSKQEEWDVTEPEKVTKDLDREGRIQKDEATISAKEAVKHEENQDAAGTSRLTIKGLPPLREYKELGENFTIVLDITEETNKKMLDTIGSTEINPVEGISKQEEWDIVEPEKETKDLHIEGTTQNDEAAKEVEKKMIEHEGIANDAVTDRPAEELPGREYQELSENSSKVPETSEKSKVKMLDTTESTEIRHPEGSLKQEEWDAIKPEKQTKDSDRDNKPNNDDATCSAQGGNKKMLKHEGIPDAVAIYRLTGGGLPPTKYLDLAENSSVVPHISKEEDQKMLDITEATVKIPVEGRLKQDKLDVPEPEKKKKDVDIEVTTLNDEATHHFAKNSIRQTKDVDLEVTALNNEAAYFSGGETSTIEHEGKADREGSTAVTVRLPQREWKELAKSSSAMPRVSEKCNEKRLENMEPTEIAVMGDTKEVKLHENMKIDNNTSSTPEKLDQEDALEAKVQPGSQTVEISEFIKNSRGNAKMPRKYNIGACSQNSVPEEKDAINKETTRISELKEEDGKSHTGNINSEVKTLNEMVGSIEVLYPEIDEDSHAQENIGRKDSEVNCTSTSAEPVLDNVTAREYQELAENSSIVPDIWQGKNEKMLDTIDSTEIRSVKGSMKQKEWEVMEPETTENDKAINSAQEGDKEMMAKNEGNANVASTNRLAEELQQQEHQELADKSSIVLEISEEGKEKMIEVMESTEAIQVEESLEQREWDVIKLENEIKALGKDSGTDSDEATCSAQGGGKEMVKHEGIPDATCSDRLTEVLPPRELQELAENSCVVPDISGEGNHKMLDITESTVIIPVEESLKQGELDVLEPKEKTKDVDIEGTIQNDEAMHSAQEGEKEMITKNEGNINQAGINILADELQQREHQELAENSCAVLEISDKGKKKLLDTMESTEIIQVEENLEQQEWDVIRLENEIKDSDRDGKTENNAATCSAQGRDKEMVKHEGILDAACIDRLTEVSPPREYQELAENFSAVPDISEGGNHKMLDIRKSTVIIPVEGSTKQDECDVLEPEKKTKDVDKEVTTLNDDVTNFPQEGEANTIAEHEENADVEGDTVVTINIAEGLPQSKHKELVENSSAMPEVSERSKEKMLDKMEPIEIAAIGDNEEVKLQENMHLDNNTSTPEKVDQEAASEYIKNSDVSAKMPSNDENIGEPCQNSLPEEKDTRDVKEKTRISQLQEEDGNLHSGNINIEVNILNETAIQVDSSIVLVYPEIDEESRVQGNIGKKEAKVTSISTSTTPLPDYIATRESPEELREILVSEDKSVQVNKINKDHEKEEEDAVEVDINTISLLECETPHCSPDEATCNTRKDTEVVNLEKQEDNTEKAGDLLTGSFEREQINTMEKMEQSHVTFQTESTQMVRTSAQERSLEDGENQKMIETVPVEMEKLDTIPFSELEKSTIEEASANDDSTDNNNILPLLQEAIMKSSKSAADNLKPSKVELKEEPHSAEKETYEEQPLASKPRETFSASLSDQLRESKKGIPRVTDDFPAEAEPNVENEKVKDLKTERAQNEELKADEEGEGDEDKGKESDNDSPVRVEAPSDTEMKATHKSCNILSGIGSKIKRSIKKVKKAITRKKSSHQKPHHQNKM